jgi:hypothetical protein
MREAPVYDDNRMNAQGAGCEGLGAPAELLAHKLSD